MAICEILSVGTEILLGDILNTNCRFLSRELASMGISVLRHTTVGDNPVRLAEAFNEALGRSDIVIATGGLGPTPDDITRDVCSKEFGFELEYNPGIMKTIEEYFVRAGRTMAPTNRRQAYAPKGGVIFPNLNGTAPGIGMKKDGKCVVLMPGPPYEMAPMFRQSVMPYLEEYRSGAIVSHEIRTIGIGESNMALVAGGLIDAGNPSVAPYCKIGEAYLRVTAKAGTPEEADRLAQPVIEELKNRLGDYVYGIDVSCVEEALVPLLKKHSLTITCAESCTAGYIAKRITDIPGASEVFKLGMVTYANEIKAKFLGVSEDTLSQHGAVSEQTAAEMARGIRQAAGADIGISVTGFAGPGADEEGKAPGLIYVGLSAPDKEITEKIETGRNDREYNRYVAASRAMNLARKYILWRYPDNEQ